MATIPFLGMFFMHKSVHTAEYRALLRWLKQARLDGGLTMDAAGAKVKKPSSWVAKTECGERRLDVLEFILYCRALRVSPRHGIGIITALIKD
ncbi:MAG: helix-turn-helix domain-containing protein [Gammaproteobacteria bacterium]